MTQRSIVRLPADVSGEFEVYLNGVRQRPGVDFRLRGRELVFDRALRKDRIAVWRWLLGALGAGTYRQDDAVDIRYEVAGQMRVVRVDAKVQPASPGEDD